MKGNENSFQLPKKSFIELDEKDNSLTSFKSTLTPEKHIENIETLSMQMELSPMELSSDVLSYSSLETFKDIES